MKKCLLLFLLPFLLLPAFARGVMSGEENLRVVKTEWFDIIFPQRSEAQAQFLASHADRIYQEIAADYGMPPQFRMPVVITPAVEQHNAYFSQAFYNHIVLYDAQPSSDMDIFSDSLISTFRHELTHAYTYNVKNGFWRGVGIVFGDTVNPGHLLITRGWAEGAALTMESLEGEGRMNCGYSLQMVRQAAIEGKFPAYADVQGARNTYPIGSFYNFNGSFNQWLQDKFGMEKYAEFWYRCINFKSVTAGGAFKKVYGLSLAKAWKNFQQEVERQWAHVAEGPMGNFPGRRDFFDPTQGGFSIKNRSGSQFTSLVASDATSEKRLFWIDAASGSIYKATLAHSDSAAGDDGKPRVKRLAAIDGISQIKPSSDGRFLLASVYSQGTSAAKLQLWLLDVEEGRWHKLSSGGREIGAVVLVGEQDFVSPKKMRMVFDGENQDGIKGPQYLLFSTKYENGASAIIIDRLVVEGKKVSVENVYEGDYHPNTYYRDFVAIGQNQNSGPVENSSQGEEKQNNQTNTTQVAFITSKGGKQSICVYDFNSQVAQEIGLDGMELPAQWGENPSIRNLSYQSETNKLVFSWAAKNTLPRLGVFNLGTGELSLQTIDVSGGIHHPVLVSDYNQEDTLAYTGKFYTHNKLLLQNVDNLRLETFSTESPPDATSQVSATDTPSQQNLAFKAPALQQDSTGDLPTTAYKSFQYYRRGVFLPLAVNLNLTYYGEEDGRTIALPVGLTWMTSNPWLMGVMVASAGYGIDTKSAAYNLSYQNGAATSLFQYQLSHGSEFDVTGDGWLQSTVTAAAGSTVPVGAVSRLTLANTGHAQFGQVHLTAADSSRSTATASSQAPGTGLPQAEGFYFHLINSASASWSNLRQWGPGPYQQLGVSVGAEVYYTMSLDLGRKNLNQNAGNMGVAASLHLPRLLPFDCVQNHTYNLPTVLTARLFPSSLATASGLGANLFSYSWGKAPTLAAMVEAETVLYSVNIQKALPLVTALYANDFSLSVRGTVGFEDRLHSADTAASSLGWSESWRLFRLDEYFSQLGSSRVPVAANIAVRAALNLSPNIGFSAHPDLGGALYLEFTTEGLTKPFAPVFTLGLTSRL